jgi:hypothetical protein
MSAMNTNGRKTYLLLDTLIDIQTPISKLAESGRADALVGPKRVDALELAVVLAGGAFVLVLARLAICTCLFVDLWNCFVAILSHHYSHRKQA